MAAVVTVTGTVGAGQSASAVSFSNITSIQIDTDKNLLYLIQNFSTPLPAISITAASTITATKSGNSYTLTIS